MNEETWRPDYIQKIHEAIGPGFYESPRLKLPPKGTAAMHTLCIVSRINTPTEDDLARARLEALSCYRMVVKNWRVVVGDGHGIDAEITRTCITWGIPLLVCGTSAAPRNGVSRRFYERVIATGTQAAKAEAREQYLLGLADRVVYFQEGIRFEQAVDVWANLPAL